MRLAVLGAGELGVACGLALRANQPAHQISLCSRDAVTGPRLHGLHVVPYPTASRPGPCDAAFVCTSLTVLEQLIMGNNEDPRLGGKALPQEGGAGPSTREATELPGEGGGLWLRDRQGEGGAGPVPFCAVFTRGLSAEGVGPVELARRALRVGRASEGEAGPMLLSVAGPIVAREWATQSTPPPKGITKPFSGTALVFTVDERAPDAGMVDALRQHLQQDLFHRESVTFLEGPNSGEVVKLINACLPLCAFGAGIVSNCYAGSNASALAAYAQHALAATEALINGLLDRPAHTPVPPCLWATLFSVCNNYSLREFVLGRQFDYHFKKAFALQAVYAGQDHKAFSSTIDGLHTLMKTRSVSSPFYEAIMDTFNTLLRASEVGVGLVKEGYYGYREPGSSVFLEHAIKIDEAIFSGNEAAFEAAKSRFIDVLSPGPK